MWSRPPGSSPAKLYNAGPDNGFFHFPCVASFVVVVADSPFLCQIEELTRFAKGANS